MIMPLESCEPIPTPPTSDSPFQIENIVSASFDKTWESILKVAPIFNATIVNQDKPSGVVVLSFSDPDLEFQKLFVNVYVKSDDPTRTTVVYVVPFTVSVVSPSIYIYRYVGDLETKILEKIQQHARAG